MKHTYTTFILQSKLRDFELTSDERMLANALKLSTLGDFRSILKKPLANIPNEYQSIVQDINTRIKGKFSPKLRLPLWWSISAAIRFFTEHTKKKHRTIIIEAYKENLSQSDLARRHGLSRERIRQILKLEHTAQFPYLISSLVLLLNPLFEHARSHEFAPLPMIKGNHNKEDLFMGCALAGNQIGISYIPELQSFSKHTAKELAGYNKRILQAVRKNKGSKLNLIVGSQGIKISDIHIPELTHHGKKVLLRLHPDLNKHVQFVSPDRVRITNYTPNKKDALHRFFLENNRPISVSEILKSKELDFTHQPEVQNHINSLPDVVCMQRGRYQAISHFGLSPDDLNRFVQRTTQYFRHRDDDISFEDIQAFAEQHFGYLYELPGIALSSYLAKQPDFKRVGSNIRYRPSFDQSNATLAKKYPKLFAELTPEEKNNPENHTLLPTSTKVLTWNCSKGHQYKNTPLLRVNGKQTCPICQSRWTKRKLKSHVESLLPHLENLSDAELYTVLEQGGAFNAKGKSREKLKKLLNRELDISALLGNDVKRDPSDSEDDSSEDSEEFFSEGVHKSESSPELETIDIEELDGDESISQDLPSISVKPALQTLEYAAQQCPDEQALQFLVASTTEKLWRQAYQNPETVLEEVLSYKGGVHAKMVQRDFLAEYEACESLEIPEEYQFRIHGVRTQPNLMQRLVAVRIQKQRGYGNWSGTGAGKTLSAILSTRVVGASCTLICCPNSVVENWSQQIKNAFPSAQVATKTWDPSFESHSTPQYLILNYEMFQQENSEAQIAAFQSKHKVDFVVIDEIHFVKQRNKNKLSKRKEQVQKLINKARTQTPTLCVLGMSATPVINNLQEAKSLVEMIAPGSTNGVSTRPTIHSCMTMHKLLVLHGTRYKPNYAQTITLNKAIVDVDCTDWMEEIRALGSQPTPLSVEQILCKARIPTICAHLEKGKQTIIYSHYVDGIIPMLDKAITEQGFHVGHYTGSEKSGLEAFRNKDIDVLLASSSVSTGVDELQYVCDRLIINVLPWTHAEFEQLIGRIYRQGQVSHKVDVIIPRTHTIIDGEEWSYCGAKWKRIQFKRSIADSAVDGVVPKGILKSQQAVHKALFQWAERL